MIFAPILKVTEASISGPSKFDGSKTYYATADVEGTGLLEGRPVTFHERPSRANLVAQRDDLLFAKMQSTHKVVHVNGKPEDAIFSTGFFNLRARSGVLDPRFLFWFLCSPQFHSQKDRLCTGATQKALTLAGLRSISIPMLDGVAEQKRVASILDMADDIRRKRELMLGSVDELIKSRFVAMFGTPQSNPKSLPMAPIKAFGRVVTGNTPPRKTPENYGDEVEWVKSDNINTPRHFLTPAEEHLSAAGKATWPYCSSGFDASHLHRRKS